SGRDALSGHRHSRHSRPPPAAVLHGRRRRLVSPAGRAVLTEPGVGAARQVGGHASLIRRGPGARPGAGLPAQGLRYFVLACYYAKLAVLAAEAVAGNRVVVGQWLPEFVGPELFPARLAPTNRSREWRKQCRIRRPRPPRIGWVWWVARSA